MGTRREIALHGRGEGTDIWREYPTGKRDGIKRVKELVDSYRKALDDDRAERADLIVSELFYVVGKNKHAAVYAVETPDIATITLAGGASVAFVAVSQKKAALRVRGNREIGTIELPNGWMVWNEAALKHKAFAVSAIKDPDIGKTVGGYGIPVAATAVRHRAAAREARKHPEILELTFGSRKGETIRDLVSARG